MVLPPVGGKGVALSVQQRRERTSGARSWLANARAPTEPRPHQLGGSLPLGRSLPLGGSLPLSGKPVLQLALAAPVAMARSARELLQAPPPDEMQWETLGSRDDLVSPSSSARSSASTTLWRGRLGGQPDRKGGTRGDAAQPQAPQPLDAGSRARPAAPPQQQLVRQQQQLEVTVTADPKARPPPEARLEIDSEIEHAEAGKAKVPGPVPIVHVVPPPTACKPATADKGAPVAKGTSSSSTSSTSTSSSAATAAAAAAAAAGCSSSSWYMGGAEGVCGTLWLGEGDAH